MVWTTCGDVLTAPLMKMCPGAQRMTTYVHVNASILLFTQQLCCFNFVNFEICIVISRLNQPSWSDLACLERAKK